MHKQVPYLQHIGRAIRPTLANQGSIIKWAECYGIAPSAPQTYCGSLKERDRLPRGSRECISELRVNILKKIGQLPSGLSYGSAKYGGG